MTLYETIIVFDSFLKDEDMQNLLTKIQNFIKNNGGKIEQLEEWGKKRLAYEINRKQYGNYVYILFSGPGSIPDLLDREYRLEEAILRYLTVKADPKEFSSKEKDTTEKETIDKNIEDSFHEPIKDDIDSVLDDNVVVNEEVDEIEKSEESPAKE